MILEDYGFNEEIAGNLLQQSGLSIGRVIAEHKERYIVITEKGEFEAEITGNMRFTAQSREDFPAVGDWVSLAIYDSALGIIHSIFPRKTLIARKAAGRESEVQIIAANIDYALLVQAVDRDFNINRLERYLTICNASRVKPIIILSKTDLIDENRLSAIKESIRQRIKDIPILDISNYSLSGFDKFKSVLEKGKTYAMLGSSGVGKSSILNNLLGKTIMKTDSISKSTNKGRHVTSHRELILLENGGILIDNPGLREVGITDSTGGLEITFDEIISIAKNCRFIDCTHLHEAGCAVIDAVNEGIINRHSYENYLRMEREKEHFESSAAERKKKDKKFGKIIKNYQKDMKKNIE